MYKIPGDVLDGQRYTTPSYNLRVFDQWFLLSSDQSVQYIQMAGSSHHLVVVDKIISLSALLPSLLINCLSNSRSGQT